MSVPEILGRYTANNIHLKSFLCPIFTTMEVMVPLENDSILSGTPIWSFRHLELQNPSTIADFRDRREKSEEEQQEQEQQQEQQQEDPIIIEEDFQIIGLI